MAATSSVHLAPCAYLPSVATSARRPRAPFRAIGDNSVTAKRTPRPFHMRPAASGDSGERDSKPAVSEDVLARLKKAEEEASELRKQLQAVQGDVTLAEEEEKPKRRIDSAGFRRETLFNKDAQDNWLKESQAVDLLVGNAPGEVSADVSAEEKATVQRRLLLGIAATIGLGAFALVPTETFRPRPSKPLFFYLTAILRVQSQLKDLERLVDNGELDRVKVVLNRMLGPPGDSKVNLENAIAWLDDNKTREAANTLAFDFLEYLQQVDYSKYFENMRTATPSGADKARFAEFSLQCVKAAELKLKDFLKLMPAEDLEAAQSQLSANVFG
uniref:Uncharacterized protein n=1 Tax=Tetraselmis chuii TaxID=63592 RepID=A0A7S1X3N2_9CHLO|mmetsp:Transcript_28715/g.51341  ORF Transcript_28715/g.51341 Transcript_28715/m.51341 type:complete len:329 (+) Transcript_28715:157-1143(+)